MVGFIKFLKEKGYINNPMDGNNSFLHNIYYNYISVNNKYDLKSNNNNDIAINYYIDDARISLKSLNNTYDIVFLDAFSPQKDPTLWTIDFLSLIKQHMNTNSVLVSYSKSTPFRNALHKLNFNVGKTFIDGIDMGTIASLDKNIIINPLNDYDLELLNTRSGITYKDFNLSLSGDEILKNREIEPIKTTLQLSKIIEDALPAKIVYKKGGADKKTFQAIRIEVNKELDGLYETVQFLAKNLKVGGRMAVITFHSLEDRIVKNAFKDLATDCVCPPKTPICICNHKAYVKLVNRKPITSSQEELNDNSRSSCAKLRIIERI